MPFTFVIKLYAERYPAGDDRDVFCAVRQGAFFRRYEESGNVLGESGYRILRRGKSFCRESGGIFGGNSGNIPERRQRKRRRQSEYIKKGFFDDFHKRSLSYG